MLETLPFHARSISLSLKGSGGGEGSSAKNNATRTLRRHILSSFFACVEKKKDCLSKLKRRVRTADTKKSEKAGRKKIGSRAHREHELVKKRTAKKKGVERKRAGGNHNGMGTATGNTWP